MLRQKGINLLSRRIAIGIQLLWLARLGLLYWKTDYETVEHAFLVVYDQTLYFLDGLLIYLYFHALLKAEKLAKKTWLHFIPFAFVFLYASWMAIFIPDWVIGDYQESMRKFLNNESILSQDVMIYILFIFGINIFYLLKSVKLTKVYNESLKENLSTIDHLTINWVQNFQRLWILLFIIPIILYFSNYLIPIVGRFAFAYLLILSSVILSIIFNSYLLEQVYKPLAFFKKEPIKSNTQKSPEQEQQLNHLESLLSEKQYYLDDELSLGKLAEYMEIKAVELTELIKMSSYENFYDLVNSYRIREVKKQLVESNEQIIQIAYQNGFRSKSTFNKIFKQKTGMTPKEYRISIK